MTKTLREWLPSEAHQQDLPRLKKLMDLKVDAEFSGTGSTEKNPFYRWPGSHKYVWSWCVLEDGSAVAWNENPGTGWSFPRLPGKVIKTDVVEVKVLLAKGTPNERIVYMDKTGMSITGSKMFAGQFARSTGEQILAGYIPAGSEGTLMTVPGITQWTIPGKYGVTVIAQHKEVGIYVEKAS